MTDFEKICRANPEIVTQLAAELLRLADRSTASVAKNVAGTLPELTLVIPVFNEEENIPELYRRINAVLAENKIDRAEMIFVNDGSRDRSEAMIRELKRADERLKLVNFSRNFGHQAAITAGIDLSRGEAVILMDADMQDPPQLIGEMLAKWREGGEIVYAVRKTR